MVSKQIKRGISIILFILILTAIFLFFYFNPSLTGFAVTDKISGVKIDFICYYEAENYDVWSLNNKNDFEIVYTWDILNSSQNGSGIALPGMSYLNTTRIDNKNKLRIFINGVLVQSKKNSIELCISEMPIEEPLVNISQNQTILDIEQNISEQNQTIENITEIILPEENQTAINESYSDIPSNQTIINETQINETLDFNEISSINVTDNETIETTVIQTTSGGVSGDSGSGGVYYPKLNEISNASLNQDNKTALVNETESIKETTSSPTDKTGEPLKIISIVGRVIKIPFDTVKVFIVKQNLSYYFVFLVFILIIIVIIFFLFKYLKKRKQASPDSKKQKI